VHSCNNSDVKVTAPIFASVYDLDYTPDIVNLKYSSVVDGCEKS